MLLTLLRHLFTAPPALQALRRRPLQVTLGHSALTVAVTTQPLTIRTRP